ncbi:MAG: nucleotide sugar dehydrogenase [Bacteroidota bacterium]
MKRSSTDLLDSIKNRDYKVGIVGLGYVGLPLMWTFHEEKFPVLGFDIDDRKVQHLQEGSPYIKHLGHEMMQKLAGSARCDATVDIRRISEVDAILLCVPTPLNEHREPDMTYVEQTAKNIAPHMRKGQLVVLESTTWPGTTEELMTPILEDGSGLTAGKDFYLAYSPEREDPGNPNFRTATIPKVVGADSDQASKIANALYGAVINEVIPVSNTRTAEAVKLTENIFRSVNIALVNELKVVYKQMDIDVHEVLDAAATKPFGFMKFTPGPGLGGHCIPIDPFYLTWKAREHQQHTRFIELAGEINTQMPDYVIQQTLKALNYHKKPMNGSKVLCMGLAYKPNVDDMRESPTFVLMDKLEEYGCDVSYYDPYIPEIGPTREHTRWQGVASIDWNEESITSFDAVLISTDHDNVDYQQLADWCDCIIDTRNAMRDIETEEYQVWQA